MNHTEIPMQPLYRMRLVYTCARSVELAGTESDEGQYFFLAEGHCEGRINGRFMVANHPYRHGDGTFMPDFQGVIETDDGAVIYFDHRGYGRIYPKGRRQVVAIGTHISSDQRYLWLNDNLAPVVGEVRSLPEGGVEIIMDWSEVIWKAIGD